jgi:hypothetical protein
MIQLLPRPSSLYGMLGQWIASFMSDPFSSGWPLTTQPPPHTPPQLTHISLSANYITSPSTPLPKPSATTLLSKQSYQPKIRGVLSCWNMQQSRTIFPGDPRCNRASALVKRTLKGALRRHGQPTNVKRLLQPPYCNPFLLH